MGISKQMQSNNFPNMRDLGGMEGADGKHIREGCLIRSQQLNNASEEDIALLEKLPLRKIIDFRNAQEAEEKPDSTFKNCSYMNLPILDGPSAVSWESNKSDTRTEIDVAKKKTKSGAEQVCEVYRNFVRTPLAREQYSRFLQEIINAEDGAVLWHCTLGKDRCGWASVLVEAVLGVCQEDIVADYMYSNKCLKNEIVKMLPILQKLLAKLHMKDAGTAPMEAREEYIMAAFDEIEKLYGSMESFLEKGLGIDASMRQKLRNRYLK